MSNPLTGLPVLEKQELKNVNTDTNLEENDNNKHNKNKIKNKKKRIKMYKPKVKRLNGWFYGFCELFCI